MSCVVQVEIQVVFEFRVFFNIFRNALFSNFDTGATMKNDYQGAFGAVSTNFDIDYYLHHHFSAECAALLRATRVRQQPFVSRSNMNVQVLLLLR